MDRPRHKQIIDDLSKLKVKIKLITDGDVAGALLVTKPIYNVDIYLGIGGGPEGVLAAAALDAYDCHFQGKFIFDNEQDIKDAKKVNIEMTLTSPNCPVAESLPKMVKDNILKLDGVDDVDLKLVWDPPWTKDKMSEAAKLELNL